MVRQGSVVVPNSPTIAGEGLPRRCYLSPDKLLEYPQEGKIRVLSDILQHAVTNYPEKNAVGWRETVRMIEEEKEVVGKDGSKTKKKWSYFELSDYKYLTYKELGEVVKKVGSALVETGHVRGESMFNIYSATSWHWQAMANGCASQGITFATAYDSLGEEGLEHSITQPSVYGLFTNASLLHTVASVISRTPSLKVLIYDGPSSDIKKDALEVIKKANGGSVKVYTWDQFVELGAENVREPVKGKPEDVVTLMYTSGSSGAPKGVLLTNANIVASVAGVDMLLKEIAVGGSYLAYLPLAHILEFVAELFMFYCGNPIGYGNVKTLTDTSVRNCVGDMRAFKPTFLVGVPAVWELIRKGIQSKAASSGLVKSTLFNTALTVKKLVGSNNLLGMLIDHVVFGPVKAAVGGNLKYGVCGGAPISRETQEFLSSSLCMVIQGYGMTESSAFSAALPPDFYQHGVVGIPMPSTEIKLVDFEEASYFSTNNPPQGEILIRGPSVSSGYYKLEDVTAEAYTSDGWLRTGDIGEWREDGTLAIIDRKKNLVKLSGGEYIALERLESVYKSSDLVSHLALHADAQANKPMAIVVPNEHNLKKLLDSSPDYSSKNVDFDTLCKDKKVREIVMVELNNVGKKAGLKGMETLQTVVLSAEEWTAQNGFLTAAQKLQRKTILNHFKDQVKAVYP